MVLTLEEWTASASKRRIKSFIGDKCVYNEGTLNDMKYSNTAIILILSRLPSPDPNKSQELQKPCGRQHLVYFENPMTHRPY